MYRTASKSECIQWYIGANRAFITGFWLIDRNITWSKADICIAYGRQK